MENQGEPAAGERVIYHRQEGPRSMREEGTAVPGQGGRIEVRLDGGAGTVPWEPPVTHLASGWETCSECRRQQALNIGAEGI
jgi:hypothetical protein